jgi:hypothetical protein
MNNNPPFTRFRFALLALLSAGIAFAQIQTVPVRITSTPEAIGTLYAVTHSKKLGKHNVMQCNKGAVPVDVPREITLQELHELPVIDVTEANILMRLAYDHNWKFTIVRYGEYAMIVVGALASGGSSTVLFTISTRGMSKLIAGIGVAHLLGDRLKGEVPSLDPFLANALTDAVHLGPAGSPTQCATRVIFTGVIHGVHGYDVTANVPVLPPATVRVAESPAPKPINGEEATQLVALVMAMPLPN